MRRPGKYIRGVSDNPWRNGRIISLDPCNKGMDEISITTFRDLYINRMAWCSIHLFACITYWTYIVVRVCSRMQAIQYTQNFFLYFTPFIFLLQKDMSTNRVQKLPSRHLFDIVYSVTKFVMVYLYNYWIVMNIAFQKKFLYLSHSIYIFLGNKSS